ncbi:MAG: hypothetical protein F6J90_32270 [Moorea sp. SIOASIH]|nr:hypothetical protein [Moorena sp. SIOASIH]NEO40760.1 hypothetical protein [Moorena sp. SIOASIH]
MKVFNCSRCFFLPMVKKASCQSANYSGNGSTRTISFADNGNQVNQRQ